MPHGPNVQTLVMALFYSFSGIAGHTLSGDSILMSFQPRTGPVTSSLAMPRSTRPRRCGALLSSLRFSRAAQSSERCSQASDYNDDVPICRATSSHVIRQCRALVNLNPDIFRRTFLARLTFERSSNQGSWSCVKWTVLSEQAYFRIAVLYRFETQCKSIISHR